MPHNALTKPPAEDTPTWAAELTLRERRFVEEYIVDLNGKAAAMRAGLGKTPKSACEIASRMRKKAPVAAAISQLISERSGTTSTAVLTEIARIAFARFPDYARVQNGELVITDTADLTEDQQAAIAEITESVTEAGRTIKIRLHDKSAALDKLAKVLGLYRERVELSGPNDGPIEVGVGDLLLARFAAMKKRFEAESGEMTILPPPAAPQRAPVPPAPPVIIDGVTA